METNKNIEQLIQKEPDEEIRRMIGLAAIRLHDERVDPIGRWHVDYDINGSKESIYAL